MTGLMNAGLTQRPEGITIEFDTYPNRCPPNGFWDPVQQPHVEINFDGRFYMSEDAISDEARCMLNTSGDTYPEYWSATPEIVDNEWHDVHVVIEGTHVRVSLDGVNVVDTQVPDFEFKGGILTFLGGSGAVTAFQRF